nr:MAG TPA: hypothetical protein [Caudoviricetes sp.]
MNLTGKIVSLKEKEVVYSIYENDIISKISELCSEYGDLADSIVDKLNYVVKKDNDPYYNPLLERGIAAFAMYDPEFNETDFWSRDDVSGYKDTLRDALMSNGFYIPDTADMVYIGINQDDIPHGLVSGQKIYDEVREAEYVIIDDLCQASDDGFNIWTGLTVYIDEPQTLMNFLDVLFDEFIDAVLAKSDKYRKEAAKFLPFTLVSEFFFEPMFSLSGIMISYIYHLFDIEKDVEIPKAYKEDNLYDTFKRYTKLDIVSDTLLRSYINGEEAPENICNVCIAILFKNYLEERDI